MLADQIPLPDLRRQDTKNRQNSIDDIDPFVKQEFEIKIRRHFDEAMVLYQSMLDMGIAKECARFVLPSQLQPVSICLVLASWIHYINLRTANGTQKEHMDLAEGCKKMFIEQFPTCAEALEWV